MLTRDDFDIAIVGGGIVGLATARAVSQRWPQLRLAVIEKENHLGEHQTGRNSGVIHSGIYYKPGSAKARLCKQGNEAMYRFAQEHGIPNVRCGKLIVASSPAELARMEALRQRALASGIDVTSVAKEEIADHEPHVVGSGGLWVPSTGIIDYKAVLDALATYVRDRGADVLLDTEVLGFTFSNGRHVLETTAGALSTRLLVNCAGLQSDRVATDAGATLEQRIVPFRGEYYELVPSKRCLVRGLVYPVPDPSFPFLGVHFTRMINGSVHAGPNAVLALAREGYRKRDVNMRDIREIVTFPGFWRLAAKHGRAGIGEMSRSFSKRLFLRRLQRLIPTLQLEDLVPAEAGVRAQMLERSGALVDDFMIVRSRNAVHVCNAPSPAATSSLQIGELVGAELAPTLDG